MKKYLILTLVLLIGWSISADAKPKKKTIYMFGLSCDYNDSIMYITEIQKIEPAYIESKTGFLYDRTIYAQQLQIFIEEALGKPQTTCVVFFGYDAKKVEKKQARVIRKAKGKEKLEIMPLVPGAFKFIRQEWTEHEEI